jgi:hypothetical protein
MPAAASTVPPAYRTCPGYCTACVLQPGKRQRLGDAWGGSEAWQAEEEAELEEEGDGDEEGDDEGAPHSPAAQRTQLLALQDSPGRPCLSLPHCSSPES